MNRMSAQIHETRTAPKLGDLHYSSAPAGLSPAEAHAYNVGYDRGARAYLKKNGGPAVVHDGDAPAPGSAAHRMLAQSLAEMQRTYLAERHAPAHKSGMSALRSYLRKTGQLTRLAEIVDTYSPTRKPAAPVVVETPSPVKPRKPRKVTPAPVDVTPEPAPDVVAAAVQSGRLEIVRVPAPDLAPVHAGYSRTVGAVTDSGPLCRYADSAAPVDLTDDGVTIVTCADCLAVVHRMIAPDAPEYVDCVDCGTRDYPGESHTCEPREFAEPEIVPDPMPRQTHAAKRASNRELARRMRAAGLPITAETWAAAKAGAELESMAQR